MSQSILDADRLSLSQAARKVGVHVSTIWRWTLHGVQGRRLASFHVGGRRYVLREELERFLEAGRDGSSKGQADREETGRRASVAAEQLEQFGI